MGESEKMFAKTNKKKLNKPLFAQSGLYEKDFYRYLERFLNINPETEF
ncbi:MAG: hypothetical protein ACFE9R_13705 [Candidatus Hermodarchaeota archaeon]